MRPEQQQIERFRSEFAKLKAVDIPTKAAFSLLHRAIASGLVDARRVILIGDPAHCMHFAARAMATAIRTIRSFELLTAPLIYHIPAATMSSQALRAGLRSTAIVAAPNDREDAASLGTRPVLYRPLVVSFRSSDHPPHRFLQRGLRKRLLRI